MKRTGSVFFAVVVVVLVGIAVLVTVRMMRENDSSVDLPVINSLAEIDVSFTDHRGEPLDLAMLKGSPWIAGFIFTRCPGQCPHMMRAITEAAQEIPENSPARIVVISVDPEFDTVSVLKAYAEKFGAAGARWHLARGDMADVRRLATEGMYLGAPKENEGEEFILHSSKFVLVDPQLRVRGYFDAFDPEEMQALPAALKAAGRAQR